MFNGTFVVAVTTLAIGALFGLAPTYIIERRKQRYVIQTRWDVPLYDVAKEFLGAARTMTHLCGLADQATDRGALLTAIDEQHSRLRYLEQQIRIVGDVEVQTHAYWTVHHMYAVRMLVETGEDPRLAEYHDIPALQRARTSWRRLIVAVRRQLKVASPSDLGPDSSGELSWTPGPRP